MLKKEVIKELKQSGGKHLADLVEEHSHNIGELVFILENLGALPASFDAGWMLPLLKHDNETVRYWIVKNIGKLHSQEYLQLLYDIVQNDRSTIVRREAVSSIGRMRNEQSIPILLDILGNSDPKIVCQAIRGLLVFKGRNLVDNALRCMINNENEVIRTIIYKEYFATNNHDNHRLPHTETYDFLKNVVVNSDVRDILSLIPEDSIHLTFTSPPYYNARDYSIYPSYDAYLKFLQEVFEQTYRVTKEGRFLIVNTSPVIIPRISRSHSSKRYPIPFDLHHILTQIGWEFIDDIIWEKPESSVKNRIGGFQQHRKPLAYKPNARTEYLMVYRKQTDKLLDWNIKQYDTQTVNDSKVQDGFESSNIWQRCPRSDNIHSAIFPPELCKRVVEYYSFKGDLIFDPFAGSGTLGRVAKKLGRNFFLTEKDEAYFQYMQTGRHNHTLFEDDGTKFLTLRQFKKSTKQ